MLLALVVSGCALLIPRGDGGTGFGAGGIGEGKTQEMMLAQQPYDLSWEVSDAEAPLDGCTYSIRLVADKGPAGIPVGEPLGGQVGPTGVESGSQRFQPEAGSYFFRVGGDCAWDIRLTPID